MKNAVMNMDFSSAIKEYLDVLDANSGGEEIQYRTPFENLWSSFELPPRKFSVVQEDRHSDIEIDGIPDFFVYEDDQALFKRLVGFIECKKPSYNLEKLLESAQIKKYARFCENIILTNYKRFILLQKNRIIHDVILTGEQNAKQAFTSLVFDFYRYDYPYIADKKTLAKTLASLSFYFSVSLREYISNKNNSGKSFYTKFSGLFNEYQKSINYYYELTDFCDIYAQSFVYALFLVHFDSNASISEHDLDFLRFIPAEYNLLHEFLASGYENRDVPSAIKIALVNIGKNINLVKIEAIEIEFAKNAVDKSSIAVYLYEDYLSEYDKLRGTENRKEGGVYYTPREAANFITRGVNYIIKNKFNLPHGFASKNVKSLDFACGTGTFLHSIIESVLNENSDSLSSAESKEKIMRDIYGFEILFTPYIIAHTVLIRFLASRNIMLGNNERLGIYLTNTLDIAQHSISALLPRLKQEHEKASNVKGEETILAIVGNPPYFGGRSRANANLIDAELMHYKKNLTGETNLQPLDDIYIKFIRFAEWKIENSGEGVIGIITNNSFLDGLVHRQMRRHLYETFDEIYIVNLHGNSQKKEGCKSIFDIRIGVSVIFLVKYKKPAQDKHVFYYSTLEKNILSRKAKLDFLDKNNLWTLKYKEIKPEATKDYWFVKKNFTGERQYKKFVKITDIFSEYSNGIACGRDAFCLKYTRRDLDALKDELQNSRQHIIEEKYKLYDSRDWKVNTAISDIIDIKNVDRKITSNYNPVVIHYRPFDFRWTSLSKVGKRFLERPRYDIMKHFDNKENIGISFLRQFSDAKPYTGAIVSRYPIEKRTNYSFEGGAYFAPLYLYGENTFAADGKSSLEKRPNWTPSFIINYLARLAWKPAPEEIFAYIYAVLSSPVYRQKYREFLKTDFPAIPLTQKKSIFEKYAALGQRLIDLHILKNIPDDASVKVSLGGVKGAFVVEKLDFANETLSLDVRYGEGAYQTTRITISGVTAQIYDFEIGSRRPVENWLKCRIKDKVLLDIEDMRHLKNMIVAIKESTKVMAEIDALDEAYLEPE